MWGVLGSAAGGGTFWQKSPSPGPPLQKTPTWRLVMAAVAAITNRNVCLALLVAVKLNYLFSKARLKADGH
jgi:hypothetical protein